jgi:SAM-dependent methyltransferase
MAKTERSTTFEELVAEGSSVPIEGWDFSWFGGRATEERPSWGYSRMLIPRIAKADAVLDIQTGGGEVLSDALDQAQHQPEVLATTESWPPNAEIARQRLTRFGASVNTVDDKAALPFGGSSFDLVTSRHPTVTLWDEISRVLQPEGTYFSQQVGPGSNRELSDFLIGPQPVSKVRSPELAAEQAGAAGLFVMDLRKESLRTTFNDIGAVVYFLRKVLWTVPDFTVERYGKRLLDLHQQIQKEGPFVAHAQRFLIEAKKGQSRIDGQGSP